MNEDIKKILIVMGGATIVAIWFVSLIAFGIRVFTYIMGW